MSGSPALRVLRAGAASFAGAAGEALRTEAAWRRVVRKLLYEGQRRHYTLGPDEQGLFQALLPESAAALDLAQPSLFDPRGRGD